MRSNNFDRLAMVLGLSALSGLMLALAFPKFNLFWLAWVALIPFFIALGKTESWKEALFSGIFFGVTFFGIHLFWILSLYDFVQGWILLGWAGLVIFQSAFILLFAFGFRLFARDFTIRRFTLDPFQPEVTALVGGIRKTTGISAALKVIGHALFIALWWVFIEWLRAWGPFGVTGGDVGYSQAEFLPLIQIAAYTQVYGVSFLVVLANISIALLLADRKKWAPLFLSAALSAGAFAYGTSIMNPTAPGAKAVSLLDVLQGSTRSVKIAVVQPAIPQKEKLDQSRVKSSFDLQAQLTRRALSGGTPEIIIWPETAVVAYFTQDPDYMARIKELVGPANCWLVTGVPRQDNGKTYNSVVSISPAGAIASAYDKEKPVPFGEYLPFRPFLYPLLKGVGYFDSEYDHNPVPSPILARGLNIATAICFESTFPDMIRQRVKKDTAFILVVTNDAWFGDSSAAYFHLNTGIFRAVENRKYFIQAGNTGFSAVIDPFGRVLKRTELNRQEILTFEVPLS